MTSPRGERVHRVAQSEGDDPQGCAASPTPGSAPLLFLRSVSLPPPVLPTRRRRYFKCRCGFTPTTSSPVKRAINHPPPSHRHLRLQDPDSRLRGGTCPTFYGRLFKVFLHFSKRSKMFHLLATILGSQRQKRRKKPKIKQGRAAPAAFPFLFLAKWISAARRRPDNPADARRLLSSRSQRGSSFGTAARRLQRWPSF